MLREVITTGLLGLGLSAAIMPSAKAAEVPATKQDIADLMSRIQGLTGILENRTTALEDEIKSLDERLTSLDFHGKELT